MGLYLIAGEGVGTKADPRRPKYVPALGLDWSAMDYGPTMVFLVNAPLTAAQETTLNANADFFVVPPINSNLTAGQVTAVETRLEANGIPAGWVSTALTWRQVLRAVAAMFQLAQRANVTITQGALDLTMAQIPTATRTALQNAALSFGFSLAGITGSTTVRAALKILADQWQSAIEIGDQGV